MSAVVPLGYEYKDLNGSPYIPCPITIDIKKRKRIGLCWRGNPKFEHEQHRVFPSDLFFDAVKNADAEFISLQKGKGEDERPEWVNKVPLDTWGNTKEAINKCDLVISSCTSVAHLAGAMGIKTWIITPILPYYLWALPGEKTPYYDSVTLFRQEKYGDWTAPFEKIKEKLEKGISKQSTEKTKTSANSAYYPEVFSVQNLEQAKNSILTDENDENKWDIETKLSVEKLIKAFSVTKDSILLDYGCGIGRIAKELIKQTDCTIIGVDSSPNMLKLSNDYVDSKNFTPCSVRNLKKLIETGLKFDAAFSILVLQHSLNPRQDIALIHYALRNEGFFYLLNENKRFLPTKSLDSNFVKWRDDGKNVAKLTEEKFVEIEDLPFKHLISKVYLKK
jgi:SAM-dependent methyltransferase